METEGFSAVKADVQAQPAPPSGHLYLALCSADPGDLASGLLAELTAAGYQRQAVSFTAPKQDGRFTYQAGTAATVSLDGSAVFGPFTDMAGSGVPVSHMALVTAATGTDLAVLAVWPLDSTVVAAQGDSLLAVAGTLTIKVN
ncbi:hypothetical protein ACFWAP_00630 [Streptomyces goshikiensis]|uniref:phage tail fiber protein n=1 Tax=Streptomyces goshikiensis TaxID=1942 RepID=UPI00366A05D3